MDIDHRPTPLHARSAHDLNRLSGVLARSYPRGTQIGQHVHPDAQLLFSAQGIMQVSTPRGRWFVPPQRAVWLPPRLPHAVDVLADIEMRSLLVPRERVEAHPEAHRLSREFVVVVGPLLREAILGSFDESAHPQLRRLLVEVALFQLAETQDPATFIPMPSEPRARHVAEQVIADPAGVDALNELARRAGASARTITRLFPSETGLTFKAWRQRARIMVALRALSDPDGSIKQVAAELGFSSVAAFSYAFRSVLSTQPTAMMPGSKLPRAQPRDVGRPQRSRKPPQKPDKRAKRSR